MRFKKVFEVYDSATGLAHEILSTHLDHDGDMTRPEYSKDLWNDAGPIKHAVTFMKIHKDLEANGWKDIGAKAHWKTFDSKWRERSYKHSDSPHYVSVAAERLNGGNKTDYKIHAKFQKMNMTIHEALEHDIAHEVVSHHLGPGNPHGRGRSYEHTSWENGNEPHKLDLEKDLESAGFTKTHEFEPENNVKRSFWKHKDAGLNLSIHINRFTPPAHPDIEPFGDAFSNISAHVGPGGQAPRGWPTWSNDENETRID